MKKLKPEEMSRNISDRTGQSILRLYEISDKLKKLVIGGTITLFVNLIILSINIYIIFNKHENELSSIFERQLNLIEQVTTILPIMESNQKSILYNIETYILQTDSLK